MKATGSTAQWTTATKAKVNVGIFFRIFGFW